MNDVLTLDAPWVPEVVDVIHESFFDYPVMRFVLGERDDYGDAVRALVHFFVMARVFRNETLIGVPGDEGLIGAALISRPGGADPDAAFYRLRDEVWAKLGREARDRYTAFGEACAPFQPVEPHLHLNMIGVRRRARGTGLGRKLIEHVHEMSRLDERSVGVTLTTEDPANVPLYQHMGYEIIGHAEVAPELRTWGFFRPDEGAVVR